MRKLHLLALILSILISVVYLSFTMLSLAKYPEPFSPVSNWLSDLGNRMTSPDGSQYYNAGIIITGILLAIFFFSLTSIRIEASKPQRIVLSLTQAVGVMGGLGMILTGVFSIDVPRMHSFCSAIFRISLGTAFGFSVAALRYYKEARKSILVIGAAATLTDLFVSVFYNKLHIFEWPVIFLFLVYCLLLGIETNRLGELRRLPFPRAAAEVIS